MKHTVLLLTASLLLATSLFGQKHNYDRVLPGHELTADLDFLWQNLQTTHASAFTYISQDQLKAQFDAARQRLANGATYPEFFLEVTALMAQINDTHSRVDVANLKNMAKKTKKLTLDVKVRIIGEAIYLTKTTSSNIPEGSQLLAVNDVPSAKILSVLRPLSVSEGNSNTIGNRMLSESFTAYLTLAAPIEANNQLLITRFGQSKFETVNYPGTPYNKLTLPEKVKKKYKYYEEKFTFKAVNDSTAMLRIPTFSTVKSKFYYPFIRKSFKQLAEDSTKVLILDLRGNTGGSLSKAMYLYRHLGNHDEKRYVANVVLRQSELSWKKSRGGWLARFLTKKRHPTDTGSRGLSHIMVRTPVGQTDTAWFKVMEPDSNRHTFTGQLYAFSDGLSASASALTLAGIKRHGLGTLVGEACAATTTGCWGQSRYLKLPNTKTNVKIALLRMNTTNDFTPDPTAVTPHHEVPYTIEGLVNEQDLHLQYLEALWGKEKAVNEATVPLPPPQH